MTSRSLILAVLIILPGTGAVNAQPSPVRVQLDSTGIASWRFVNPVRPPRLDGQPLIFYNTTGDRTFVVTMPFVYTTAELTRAYAVAHDDRGEQTVEEVVCSALISASGTECSPADRQEISLLEGLRTLLEATSAATKPPESWCNLDNAACVVETLFWTSACRVPTRDLLQYANSLQPPDGLPQNVQADTKALVDRLFDLPTHAPGWPRCSPDEAQRQRTATLQGLPLTFDQPLPADTIAAAAQTKGRQDRFAEERMRLARETLITELKERLERQIDTLSGVFTKLEALRNKYESAQRHRAQAADVLFYQCRLREVEAAGKLLRSYAADSDVPYAGVPKSLINPTERCSLDRAQSYAALTARIRESLVERASEQGIEITECDRDATPMVCIATATIPPYQSAAFSGGILAHHPEPRIRFNVAFFGEPEAPSNATGYVLRSDAKPSHEKPKGQTSFGFGSDASVLLDPVADLTGQRRHSSASGTLTFQHAGPFEVSATLQYKKGDLGALPSNRQVDATQYQAKIFGGGGTTFQYGHTVFARPSAGIAVSVAGEGLQAALGYGSVSYVINRESDTGVADSDDDDHHVVLLQLKSLPLRLPMLRTLDLIALFGEEKRDESTDPVPPLPYEYWTVGGETRFGFQRFPSLAGSVAAYHSRRNVGPLSDPAGGGKVDGRGSVGLLRMSWTSLVKPPLTEQKQRMRPAFGVSAIVGYGTGDGSDDGRQDDYLGENAGYANDQIFLSRLAQVADYTEEIGTGLANKTYAGLQYTDSRFSPLFWVSRLLQSEEDVETQTSILSAHGYWFHEPVREGQFGGVELDVEFQLESPKNVRWSLVGAYYVRSEAVERLGLEHDPWSVTAKVAITLR